MISQKYRFHSRGGVRHTYQHGKSIRTSNLNLVYAPNSHNAQRFGVVVSKKVLRSAVGRNRIRRRLYEAIRLELPHFKAEHDCVFVVYNKNIMALPFHELRYLVHDLLERSLVS